MQQRHRPPDLHRRSRLLAPLPWLPVPALAGDTPLREAMRRAEALRDEARHAGDQPCGAVVRRGAIIASASPSRMVAATDPAAPAAMEAIRCAAHTERARLLVAHGATLQLADANGVTPLAHAEQCGQRAFGDILRRAGVRP